MDRAPKAPTWLLATLFGLFIFLIVGPFLVTISGLRAISATREIILIVIFIVALKQRKSAAISFFKDDLERLIGWLIALFILTTLLFTRDLFALLWSARYSLEPLLLFWAMHTYSFKETAVSLWVRRWLLAAVIAVLAAVLMVTLVPKQTLLDIGYSADVAVGDGQWVAEAKLPAYQTVAGSIPRLQGTLTGPIQFAGFALLFLFLALNQQRFFGRWHITVTFLALIAVVGSFSRAAIIAAAVIGLVALLRQLTKKGWSKSEQLALGIIVTVAILVGGGLWSTAPNSEGRRVLIANILARDLSDRQHVASITDTLQMWPQIGFFGLGAGRSGAGSIQNSSLNEAAPPPRFVDNSYLRWFEELGLVGALAFIGLILILLRDLAAHRSRLARSLAQAGIALAITAFFTDMWLEAVPALTFFSLAGILHEPIKRDRPADTAVATFNVSTKTTAEVMEQLVIWSRQLAPHVVVTLNPEMIVATMSSQPSRRLIQTASLITADGVGIRAGAMFLTLIGQQPRWRRAVTAPFIWLYLAWLVVFTPGQIRPLPERVTGADLTAAILAFGQQHHSRLALLGSTEAVISESRRRLAQLYPNLRLVFADFGPQIKPDGTISSDDLRRLVSRLMHAKPHFLLVAFGVPKQELFLNRYAKKLSVPVMIGVSGAFDSTLAATVRRAPRLLQQLSLEWLWRLITQPRRWRRICNALFVYPYYLTKLALDKTT